MSQADSNSNPTSDYDFGEIQQDDVDEELNMMKPELQKLDMNLLMILNRFPLSDMIVANFAKHCIENQSQLKDLRREDLIKLGIEDNRLQDEMLEEFRSLEGPVDSPENEEEEKEQKKSDVSNIIETLQQHLFRLNTLLAAITFQIGASSSSSTGIVINQQFCSTQVVMHLLHQLQRHTAQMDGIVNILADSEKLDETEETYLEKKRKERKRNCIVFMSTLGFFITGYYIAKRLGIKKVF